MTDAYVGGTGRLNSLPGSMRRGEDLPPGLRGEASVCPGSPTSSLSNKGVNVRVSKALSAQCPLSPLPPPVFVNQGIMYIEENALILDVQLDTFFFFF